METWQIVVAVLVASTAVTLGLHKIRGQDPAEAMRLKMEADARQPLRRWVQSAFLVITGDCDYGHLGRGEARRMLETWWDVHGPHDLDRTLDELGATDRPDNAWDLLRFILVARMGAGSGYIDDDDSWAQILPIAQRLQDAYSGWRAMARAYVVARRQWRCVALDGSEDDDEARRVLDNIADLEDSHWAEVDYAMTLASEGG